MWSSNSTGSREAFNFSGGKSVRRFGWEQWRTPKKTCLRPPKHKACNETQLVTLKIGLAPCYHHFSERSYL
jgi:hypothetical protein